MFKFQLNSELLRANPLFSQFLSEFRLYCEKIPKGFEKYYKKPSGGQKTAPKEAESKAETKDVPKDGEQRAASSTSTPPGGGQPSSSSQKQPPKDWNLGMFTPSGGSKGGNRTGGQGRPIGSGEPERDKMLILGALGGIALVAAIAFIEMGYKEIAWKDFVNK